ncbi:MAG: flagellar hook assembly protein FlgD [Rhizobiales bacterium]|nr:flagellar hook assembly protein FlgD [Hyphomicrobiales bacterium]
MDIASATAAAQAQTGASSQSAATALSGNYDMFLSLLTTQLQHQDPTSPMKSEEFTQQLVQYSSVEQQIQSNSNLETLIATSLMQNSNSAVSLLGKEVQGYGTGAALKDGAANWSFNLAVDAPQTTLEVINKEGATVYSKTVEGSEGANSFAWDGKNNAGTAQPDGTYYLRVTALAEDGKSVQSDTMTKGIVTDVDLTSTDPLLTINGAQIKYSEVTSVRSPTTTD